MDTISIVLPTRKRINGLQELFQTLIHTTKFFDRLQICLVIDDDDLDTITFVNRFSSPLNITSFIIPHGKYILSQWWNIGYENIATGSILMLCADDFRFRSQHWDQLVYDAFNSYPDKILLLYGDDLFISKRLKIATFSFVHRTWIDNSPNKKWFPEYFTTDYIDTWLGDVADSLQRKIFLPDLVIEHCHFLIGKNTKENDDDALHKAYSRIMDEKKMKLIKKFIILMIKLKKDKFILICYVNLFNNNPTNTIICNIYIVLSIFFS